MTSHCHHRFHRQFFRHLLAACAALSLCLTGTAAEHPLSTQQCLTMKNGNTLRDDNPVRCERLVQVTFSYIDFQGRRHEDGKIVVLDAVASQVQAIFDALLARAFPLQQARLMETYQGDDQAAMLDNNTSAFNGRPITGGSGWSKHAYGVAIDINPLQNPYLSKAANHPPQLLPPTATMYVTRTPSRQGMAEAVREIFFQHGFLIWGGNWHEPVDYQHFEIGSRNFISELLALSPLEARRAFDDYAAGYRACRADGTSTATCIAQNKR